MSTTFQGNTGTSLQAFDPSFGPNTPGRDLSAYMTSVNSIAILTPEHELELAKQYYYNDNVDAARQLVLAHLRFVVHLAKSYSGYGLSQADLSRGQRWPHEGGKALQPRSRRAPRLVCGALD